MEIQKLFKDKIIDMTELTPGYENHGSDVWCVKTKYEEVIVRASKVRDINSEGPFWFGCKEVFGINPQNVYNLEKVNNVLKALSSIPIPKVLKKTNLDREYIVLEKLAGKTLKSFIGASKEVLNQLGVGLAQIHKKQMNYCGNPSGTFKVELKNFHQHLIKSMKKLIERFYLNDEKIVAKYPEICADLQSISSPKNASYVLVDMDPTQFLSQKDRITGLVDTEAYVAGPRELDFIALEFVLDKTSSSDFKMGYQKILEIPDLTSCRLAYRYLYRLIEIQGRDDLDEWLNYPILF